MFRITVLGVLSVALISLNSLSADEPAKPTWNYAPELLRPFWEGDVAAGESVLFIKDAKTGEARASVLFPVRDVLAVRNSVGDVTYENGKDFVWKPESREFVLPAGSRIPSHTPQELRRPAKSQKYELTHRDGNGEIFFGGRLEYAEMQTCITYRHAPGLWKSPVPTFDPKSLPRSVARLVSRQPLSIVTLGDSISAGANASALYDAAPYQPAYPDLVRRQLAERFRSQVEMKNLAVGGTDTAWGLTQIDKLVEAQPQLVILAFGMNDSAGRPAKDYQVNTQKMIAAIREKLPDCEFILVASMLGNRDWVRLKHEAFPQYRDALKELVEPGVALADLTSIWTGFLELKQDWDQTGNGVNHPNDFGHRVYAQVITTLLDPTGHPSAVPEQSKSIQAGPLKLIEQRLLGNYTYSYACAAADLDGDGDLDLTSSDAEPNSNLYLLRNDGKGRFEHSFIQKYAGQEDQPIRLERHAIGDINRDGRPDVVIVDNLKWDIRWFENPGKESIAQPWKLHRVAEPKEVPGSYDVALADFDADGDLDVAASSWRFGNRFDWFENVGTPGNGEKWLRHEIINDIGETRTIAVADFNRDGKPDLLGTARTTNQIVWFANSGKPATEPWKKTLIDDTTVAPTHGHPTDIDGDGDLDVLMAFGLVAPVGANSPDSHQVAWYENVGRPGLGTEWKKHLIAGGFAQGFEAVAGDLDGDGDQDVVATGWSPTGQLAWFENTGDPRSEWKQHSIKQNWSNAVTVILADLDQDGRLDIVACAERGANELRWWRNDGVGR
jgi:lysophospholipase L1-like esterase